MEHLRHRKKDFCWRQQLKVVFQGSSDVIWISLTVSSSAAALPLFFLKQLYFILPLPLALTTPLPPSFHIQQTEGGCWQTLPLSTKLLPVSGNLFPARRYYNSTKSIPQECLTLSLARARARTHTHAQYKYSSYCANVRNDQYVLIILILIYCAAYLEWKHLLLFMPQKCLRLVWFKDHPVCLCVSLFFLNWRH